ncbi:MAG: hypothetical protein P9M13_01525 [Candidatus Ancaeobacter aquaticus]|nr:hypothetical protein [Candidatus Ancaeobacter aquaticus]
MPKNKFIPYPIEFEPIFKEKVWGGQNLKKLYSRNLPEAKKIGESWEISALGNDVSKVAHGEYKGLLLTDLINKYTKSFLGADIYNRFGSRFPLLYKIIDAHKPFSVQVHPDDIVAKTTEKGSWGKTELWYMLKTFSNTRIITGIKDWVGDETLINALQDGTIEQYLEESCVSDGDGYYIPAGRIHGLKGSAVFFEIQESSDLTYRLYDWDHNRELDIDKAIPVIEPNNSEEQLLSPVLIQSDDFDERLLIACDHFTVEKITVTNKYSSLCNGEKFQVIFVTRGDGRLQYGKRCSEMIVLREGGFYYLPAALDQYKIVPDKHSIEFLKSFVT